MNDNYRARIARLWLYLAAVAAGWLLWPQLGLWPWLLMPAMVPCCCDVMTCDCCTTQPEQLSVVIAGLADVGGCNCDYANSTWVLDHGASCGTFGISLGNCLWRFTDTVDNGCGGSSFCVSVVSDPNGADCDFYLSIGLQNLTGFMSRWKYVNVGGADDCGSWTNQAFTFLSDDPTYCVGDSSTADVTAL